VHHAHKAPGIKFAQNNEAASMIVAPRFPILLSRARARYRLRSYALWRAFVVQELRFPSFVPIVDVTGHSCRSPDNMVFVIECFETAPANFDTADVIDLQNQFNFT